VSLKETIRGFKMICDGECDHLPEQAFYMFGGIDEEHEPLVRVLAEDPTQFAYGPAVEAAPYRYLTGFMLLGLACAMPVFFFRFRRTFLQRLQERRTLLERGQLVSLTLLSRQCLPRDQRPADFDRLTFRLDLSPEPSVTLDSDVHRKARFLGEDKGLLLGLVLPEAPTKVSLVEEELRSLDLTAKQENQIRATMAARAAANSAPKAAPG
jgi:hypothetical protein